MTKLEDFIITKEYELVQEDEDAIKKATKGDSYNKSDWKEPVLNDFKTNLRNHLRKEQNCRCAYCRMKIHENEATAEIDHIIPKNIKSDWMYTPFNLCLSCKMCNTQKGRKSTLANNDVSDIPKDTNSYLIVHPHIDTYSEHITIVDDILYKGISKKGKATIKVCKLNRYELAAARADLLIESQSDNVYLKIALALNNPDRSILVNNFDKFIQRIRLNDTIQAYLNSIGDKS